jgi:type VI protein secretion system component VasK
VWVALLGTGLGWATSVIVLVWQLGRVRRELAQSRGQVQQLEVDVRRLGEHVEHQVQLINGLHELWREDRSRPPARGTGGRGI